MELKKIMLGNDYIDRFIGKKNHLVDEDHKICHYLVHVPTYQIQHTTIAASSIGEIIHAEFLGKSLMVFYLF